MTKIDIPPVGAIVRHTSTYPSGAKLVMEGPVYSDGVSDPVYTREILIGDSANHWSATLVDRPGDFTVALEVLQPPPPLPEPPHGFVGRHRDIIWERDDHPEQTGVAKNGHHWYKVSDATAYTWAGVCEDLDGPLVELVPDPAAAAPAPPWEWRDVDGDEIGLHAFDGDHCAQVVINSRSRAVNLTAQQAREFAGSLLRVARDREQEAGR